MFGPILFDSTWRLAMEMARAGRTRPRQPRISDWSINGWGQSTLGVDVADLAMGPAGYLAPANINVNAGTVDLALHKPSANLSFRISGTGGGLGLAAGWSLLPALTGRSATLAKHAVAKKVVNTAAANASKKGTGAVNPLAMMPATGIGSIVAGPMAPSVLAPVDFEGYLTLVGGRVNFGVNGMFLGAAFFAARPVITPIDFLSIRAFGLLWDIHTTAGTVDAGANYAAFKCKVEPSSLALPGALHGLSVPA